MPGLVLEGERLLLAEVSAGASPASSSGFTAGRAHRRFCLAGTGHLSPAAAMTPRWSRPPGKALLSLRESQRLIEAAHTDLSEALGLGHTPAPAAAWFLDNALSDPVASV